MDLLYASGYSPVSLTVLQIGRSWLINANLLVTAAAMCFWLIHGLAHRVFRVTRCVALTQIPTFHCCRI